MSHLVTTSVLTATAVNLALQACLLCAEKIGVRVCISLCTVDGMEQGFLRMNGTPDPCAGNARDKAYTAATFGLDTKAWDDALDKEHVRVLDGLKRRPRFTAFGGGLPIKTDNEVIVGGIGISGASEAQDELIAVAGMSVLDLKK